jgi:hypothetical protein
VAVVFYKDFALPDYVIQAGGSAAFLSTACSLLPLSDSSLFSPFCNLKSLIIIQHSVFPFFHSSIIVL